jgi:hypothetical protein
MSVKWMTRTEGSFQDLPVDCKESPKIFPMGISINLDFQKSFFVLITLDCGH